MKKKIFKKVIVLMMLEIFVLSLALNVFAKTKSVKAGEYGYLRAGNSMHISGNCKFIELETSTTSKVAPSYYIRYNVVYNSTGVSITGDFNVPVHTPYLYPLGISESVPMSGWKNKFTGKYDGFVNTKITAYSTHEVRGKYAYGVYLSETL